MTMRYRHLKPFSGLGKAIAWFSWANVLGVAAGWQAAKWVADLLPLVPWQITYAALMGLGYLVTQPHLGRPLYAWAGIWAVYFLRRQLAPATLEIWSRHYYPVAGPALHGPAPGPGRLPGWTPPPRRRLPTSDGEAQP
jgi:hypothetical protein